MLLKKKERRRIRSADGVYSSYREISEVNKGRKMLEKMGWKKGEGLGKEGTGMKDPVRRRRDFLFFQRRVPLQKKLLNVSLFFLLLPFTSQIQLKIRKSQSGLGAGVALSVDSLAVSKSKSQKNWEKARERFADSCQEDTLPSKSLAVAAAAPPPTWVRAEQEAAAANAQPGFNTDGQSQE